MYRIYKKLFFWSRKIYDAGVFYGYFFKNRENSNHRAKRMRKHGQFDKKAPFLTRRKGALRVCSCLEQP
jgi:hypothetical protein